MKSSSMISYTVGEAWPHGAAADGMKAMIAPAEDGLSVMLAVHLAQPSPAEVKALKTGALRVGVFASAPLAWFVVDAGVVSMDAPYSAGITSQDHRTAILKAAQAMQAMKEDERLLISLALIDRGVVRALRAVSVSPAWTAALAAAVLLAPATLAMPAYEAAIARDSQLTTREMMARAQAVEAAGRL